MKPNTISEIQEVINAHLRGEEIEMNSLMNPDDDGWLPWSEEAFYFDTLAYRPVKLNDLDRIAKALGMQEGATADDIVSEIQEIYGPCKRRQPVNLD